MPKDEFLAISGSILDLARDLHASSSNRAEAMKLGELIEKIQITRERLIHLDVDESDSRTAEVMEQLTELKSRISVEVPGGNTAESVGRAVKLIDKLLPGMALSTDFMPPDEVDFMPPDDDEKR